MTRAFLCGLLMVGLVSAAAISQAKPGDSPSRGPANRDGAEDGPPPPRPPKPPMHVALDTDKDNVISADELAKATTSLLTLDKNGDGKLTPDEYRPAHADMRPGVGDGSPGQRRRPDPAAGERRGPPPGGDPDGDAPPERRSKPTAADQDGK